MFLLFSSSFLDLKFLCHQVSICNFGRILTTNAVSSYDRKFVVATGIVISLPWPRSTLVERTRTAIPTYKTINQGNTWD